MLYADINLGHSGNGLLPDATKLLPEPILTNHQNCSLAFTSRQFHKKFSWILFIDVSQDCIFIITIPGTNELKYHPEVRVTHGQCRFRIRHKIRSLDKYIFCTLTMINMSKLMLGPRNMPNMNEVHEILYYVEHQLEWCIGQSTTSIWHKILTVKRKIGHNLVYGRGSETEHDNNISYMITLGNISMIHTKTTLKFQDVWLTWPHISWKFQYGSSLHCSILHKYSWCNVCNLFGWVYFSLSLNMITQTTETV